MDQLQAEVWQGERQDHQLKVDQGHQRIRSSLEQGSQGVKRLVKTEIYCYYSYGSLEA